MLLFNNLSRHRSQSGDLNLPLENAMPNKGKAPTKRVGQNVILRKQDQAAKAQATFDVSFQKRAAALGSVVWLARLIRVAKRMQANGLRLK
jgi:hypothetical protein